MALVDLSNTIGLAERSYDGQPLEAPKAQPTQKKEKRRGGAQESQKIRASLKENVDPRGSRAERLNQAPLTPDRTKVVGNEKLPLGGFQGCKKVAALGSEVEDMCESESIRMVWNAARDLCQLWASQSISGPAPRALSPWMQVVLSKFSRRGPPGLANHLMRAPATMPPKPPIVEAPMKPCFLSEFSEELQEGSYATLTDDKLKELYGPAGTRVKVKELDDDGWVLVSIVNTDHDAWMWRSSLKAEPTSRSQLQDFLADGLSMDGCHRYTERVRPYAEDILRCISPGDRQQSVLWLTQVCAVHQFDESVLLTSVMLLDRYCASSEEPVELGRAHLTILAILSIALKVIGHSASGGHLCEHPRFIAEMIGKDKFTKQEIASAEFEVVKALKYEVAAHTPLEFLESFLFSVERPKPNGMPSALVCVATFLLQLSLGDANILHRYPCAALAAGAVYVGLWCTQASSERCQLLLQDATEVLSAPPTPYAPAADLVPGGESYADFEYSISVV